MQNILFALLHWSVRFLGRCLGHIGGYFVLPAGPGNTFALGAFPLGIDLDSTRLDPVSRSVLWGTGAGEPAPVPVVACSRHTAVLAAAQRGAPRGRYRFDA